MLPVQLLLKKLGKNWKNFSLKPVLKILNWFGKIKVRFFYEFDYVNWLKFWVLSQAETIITNVFTLAKLEQLYYTVYPQEKSSQPLMSGSCHLDRALNDELVSICSFDMKIRSESIQFTKNYLFWLTHPYNTLNMPQIVKLGFS